MTFSLVEYFTGQRVPVVRFMFSVFFNRFITLYNNLYYCSLFGCWSVYYILSYNDFTFNILFDTFYNDFPINE